MTLPLLLLRIDARRPASWLVLVASTIVAATLAARGGAGDTPTLVCGAFLAAAATGVVPRSPAATLLAPEAWESCRLLWLAAGAVIGTGSVAVAGGSPAGAARILLAILVGALGVARSSAAARRRGLSIADATSVAILLACGAAFAGWCVGRSWSGTTLPAAAAAWICGFALLRSRRPRPLEGIEGLFRGGAASAGADPFAGPARRGLTAVGMVTGLACMVLGLFLVPEGADGAARVAAACFVALAVPAAFLDERRVRPGWGRLARTVLSPRRPGRVGGDPLPRSTVWIPAAVIAWPAVVAGMLSTGEPDRARAAFGIVAWVAGPAAALSALATWSRRSFETTLSLALCAAALVAAADATQAARARPSAVGPARSLSTPPRPPGLPGPAPTLPAPEPRVEKPALPAR